MELKSRQTYFYMLPPDSSNRTFMELKYALMLRDKADAKF